ncbi:hypothetical protein [Ascidiimonas sp. W6]|uniref:hypothetical protein n=1 Tax=Ascidiimonas meishanensis TaxID=3128903 RepID=UPI0030EDBBDB
MKKFFVSAGLLSIAVLTSCSSDSSDNTTIIEQDPVVETTELKDPAFEQSLIDLGFDTTLDGSVLTANIENIRDLILNDKGITDLTGIEDFINLENLWANDNALTTLDVSNNGKLKFIFVDNNEITSLDVANLSSLEKIGAANNGLSSINVSGNLNLQLLVIPDNNITAIDVANNSQLNSFSVVNNPLTCIKVSASRLNNIPSQWEKDEEDTYAISCN